MSFVLERHNIKPSETGNKKALHTLTSSVLKGFVSGSRLELPTFGL